MRRRVGRDDRRDLPRGRRPLEAENRHTHEQHHHHDMTHRAMIRLPSYNPAVPHTDTPAVTISDDTRRRFLAHFAAAGFGSTLAPGVVWARMQDAATDRVTLPMVTEALTLSGITLPEEDRIALVDGANNALDRLDELRAVHIPNDVSPPYHFSPLVPGMTVERTRQPWVTSKPPAVKRPADLEAVAFWPLGHLAELVRTRQVTSAELTRMYLGRLHRHNAVLNNVVTFLDDHGLAEAARADKEIGAGRYKGPLHGIPWGVKDIITVKGFKTTWGSPAFVDQQFDYDASIVEMLREAGAVLIAKLATGELAAGDNWFGGQTRSPWDPTQGSSGSSAGPASATAAGGVAFAIGSETSGSILSPAGRCGVVGLRPTFGRVSRHGAMALVVDAGPPRPVLPACRGLRAGHAGHRQARRARHERDRPAVQLERAPRRVHAQGRHPAGLVRRADRAGRQGQRRGHARSADGAWREDVGAGRGPRLRARRERHRRRVSGVLR